MLQKKESVLEIPLVVYEDPAIKFYYKECLIWIRVFSLSVHKSDRIFLLWNYLKQLKQYLVKLILVFLIFTVRQIFLK
jgi:hypothetical protein